LNDVNSISLKEHVQLHAIEKEIEFKPITRKISEILGLKTKSARRRMRKYAPDHMVDYDSLSYWNGDIPKEVVKAIGQDVIALSHYIGNSGSISALHKIKVCNKDFSTQQCISAVDKKITL